MSNSGRPHRQQPTRLPHPWDSPGKNTGVGCHFLLQCMKVKIESKVTQSCLTLSDPMDCSLQGSSIHGIFQARVLEWGAIALSRGSSRPGDWTRLSYTGRQILYYRATRFLSAILITEDRTCVAAERQGTACRIPSVCSSWNFVCFIYCRTLEEQKLPFPSGLCADIKD